MNCKPGDLAVIVSTLGYRDLEPRTLGRIVKVVRPAEPRHPFGFMWEVEHHDIQRVADACLRPILPPPGSVTDEEVRDLYSKQPHPAHDQLAPSRPKVLG